MTVLRAFKDLPFRRARAEIAASEMDIQVATSAAVYRRRRTAISRSEREWRVEADALVTRGGSGRERRYPWAEVISVRLRAAPTRTKPFRHVFELHSKHGPRIEIDNAHCLGPRRFEDRSGAYAPFVRAAVARIAVANPKARALIGETPKRYYLLVLGALVTLSLAAIAIVAVPTPLDGLAVAPLLKFGLILLMLPIFGRWVVGAMPKGVALDAVPERALPPAGRSGD